MITIPTDSAPRRWLLIATLVLAYLAAIAWATDKSQHPTQRPIAFDSQRR